MADASFLPPLLSAQKNIDYYKGDGKRLTAEITQQEVARGESNVLSQWFSFLTNIGHRADVGSAAAQ